MNKELGKFCQKLLHEVNNPLNVISARIELIQLERQGDEKLLSALGIIRNQIDRIIDINTKMMLCSRPMKLKLDMTDINELVDKQIRLFSEEMKFRNIEITQELDRSIPLMLIDAELIGFSVKNMIQNAIEAMPRGGKIEVQTLKDKGMVHIKIKDQGKGIPKGLLNKVFKPFYTTKANGLGLGLSVAKDVAAMHKGRISVESDLNSGSVFIVKLPLS